MFAGEARDVALLVAVELGLTIPGLDQLDAAIDEHMRWAETRPTTT
jgi:hypothetical protein